MGLSWLPLPGTRTAITCLAARSTLLQTCSSVPLRPFAPPVPYRVERAKIKSDAVLGSFSTDRLPARAARAFVSGCGDHGVTDKTSLLVTVVLVPAPVHCASWTVRCQESACR